MKATYQYSRYERQNSNNGTACKGKPGKVHLHGTRSTIMTKQRNWWFKLKVDDTHTLTTAAYVFCKRIVPIGSSTGLIGPLLQCKNENKPMVYKATSRNSSQYISIDFIIVLPL